MKHKYLCLIVLGITLTILSAKGSAEELYFIDAHSSIGEDVADLATVIQRMDENSVYRTILEARGKRGSRSVLNFGEDNAERIVPVIRTHGGAYQRNSPKYYKKLNKRNASGRWRAIGEVVMYRTWKGNVGNEVVVYPDDKRVRAALEVAKENGWPFIAHIEFAAIGGNQRKRFMRGLKELLTTNSDLSVVLIHLGQLQAKEARQLLSEHSNLHLMTSKSDTITDEWSSKQSWSNMFFVKKLKGDWKALINDYPDRFIFALDNDWAERWKKGYYRRKIKLWRNGLAELPSAVAHAVAHGNAERLWKLKPK